jgi:hypothetical protein
MVGRNLEGLADQLECSREISRIQSEHAEQMQTVPVTRFGVQDFPVKALSLVQTSGAVAANSQAVALLDGTVGNA